VAPLAANSKPYARASLFLVGLAWVLPFLQPYHALPLGSFYNEWLAFVLGLAAASLLIARRHTSDFPVPLVAIAPLGLLLVYLAQLAVGRILYPEQVLTAALYLLWAALLVGLGAALRRDFELREVAVVLSWCLVAGGVLSALAGVLQYYSVRGPFELLVAPSASRVHGNLGQANNLADYLALSLAALAYLFSLGRAGIAFSAAVAGTILYTLALSGSRASWLYLAWIAALAVVLCLVARPARHGRLLGFSLALLAGFLAINWMLQSPALQALATLPTATPGARLLDSAADVAVAGTVAGDPGFATRLRVMRAAWSIFIGAPMLGVGLGQFAWHQFESVARTGYSASEALTDHYFDHAHNIVLYLLAETGLAGALVVLVPLLAWFAGFRRQPLDVERWWLLALAGVIAIHSLLEYPLWYSYFLGIAAVLLGLGAVHLVRVRMKASESLVVGLALGLGWLNVITMLHSYRGFERLLHRAAVRDTTLGPEFQASLAPLLREPVLRLHVERALAGSMSISPDRLQDKLEVNTRAMRITPSPFTVYRQVFLLALSGRHQDAAQLLDQAGRVYPGRLAEVNNALVQLSEKYPESFLPLLRRSPGVSGAGEAQAR
jgi:O-antigen ligase